MWNEVQANNSVSLFTTSTITADAPPSDRVFLFVMRQLCVVLVLSNTRGVRLLDAARAPEDTQERTSGHDTVRLYSSPPLRPLHPSAPLLPPTCSKPLQESLIALCTAALPRMRMSFRAPLSNNLCIDTQDESAEPRYALRMRLRPLIISASHLRAPCLHYAFFSSTALSSPIPRKGEVVRAPELPPPLPRSHVLELTHTFSYLPLAPPPADHAFFALARGNNTVFLLGAACSVYIVYTDVPPVHRWSARDSLSAAGRDDGSNEWRSGLDPVL
ncbi:hypothetical protein C8J57DRAFT_1529969 [Mycena rebaudengoi]|nr:hypothetical protein C8J57DRAFT_1529969 [Mycena rebaudengoi]